MSCVPTGKPYRIPSQVKALRKGEAVTVTNTEPIGEFLDSFSDDPAQKLPKNWLIAPIYPGLCTQAWAWCDGRAGSINVFTIACRERGTLLRVPQEAAAAAGRNEGPDGARRPGTDPCGDGSMGALLMVLPPRSWPRKTNWIGLCASMRLSGCLTSIRHVAKTQYMKPWRHFCSSGPWLCRMESTCQAMMMRAWTLTSAGTTATTTWRRYVPLSLQALTPSGVNKLGYLQDEYAPLDLGKLTQNVEASYEDMVRGHIVCGTFGYAPFGHWSLALLLATRRRHIAIHLRAQNLFLASAEKYADHSELAVRVRAWEERIRPLLEAEVCWTPCAVVCEEPRG